MIRLLLLKCLLLLAIAGSAETITVSNAAALKAVAEKAKPGDIIILQNGEWKDIKIELTCAGTKEQPITFKAQNAGKVLITGNSNLELGGSFIVVEGLYFTNGYAGKNAVITFRTDKNNIANNCRVTNTVINDFNNPKRMDENYWISFYGKNNRLDHCTFLNKKNMGVLLAVILDDDRSRENFHSIDHNYFAVRRPLASNSGEIIRVGVSQHCEFNSNTQITDNYFKDCDGETEIVSIKSGSNVVRNNLFEECQGGVVLRHGNFNTVEGNVFLGNKKAGTGGVRIINKGQWVVNNYFSECRGTGFRSPLSIMNGVPNSPAFRYVAVTDAVVANNSFINCTPISLCEGSDTERSVTPQHVIFQNNVFRNDHDNKIYNAYDDISGIGFTANAVSDRVKQDLVPGFVRVAPSPLGIGLPTLGLQSKISDSLKDEGKKRLAGSFSNSAGFNSVAKFNQVKNNATKNSGAAWFTVKKPITLIATSIKCADVKTLLARLAAAGEKPLRLQLTGNSYIFEEPVTINGNITLTSSKKLISFSSNKKLPHLFEIKGNAVLKTDGLYADLEKLQAETVFTSDVTGTSNHSSFIISNSTFKNAMNGFFTAAKSVLLDSLLVKNSSFSNIGGTVFDFKNETDKKGYYNVEILKMTDNTFTGNKAQLLGMLRGGNDESTMGPLLIFSNNKITDCNSIGTALIDLYGTQVSYVTGNKIVNSNKDNELIRYEDAVRAAHYFNNNKIIASGKIITNKFVEEKNNITQ